MTRPKVKIKELEWYADFSSIMHQIPLEEGEELMTPEECYEIELKWQKKEGRNYDGPLRYIYPCIDTGLPKKEGVMFCYRLRADKKNEYWKSYECYCYQIGQWWKFKGTIDTLNSDFYVPQFISEYDYDNLKINSHRILNEKAKNDVYHHRHQKELRKLGRDMSVWRYKILKD